MEACLGEAEVGGRTGERLPLRARGGVPGGPGPEGRPEAARREEQKVFWAEPLDGW